MAGDAYRGQTVERAYRYVGSDATELSTEAMIWASSQGRQRVSSVALQETATEVVLQIELPERLINVLDLRVTADLLSLRGEQREHVEVPGYCSFDYAEQQYRGSFLLPTWVNPSSMRATMQMNTLLVTLAKADSDQSDHPSQEVELIKQSDWLVAR
jgi:HSP20 family molecular chaperone IbpA